MTVSRRCRPLSLVATVVVMSTIGFIGCGSTAQQLTQTTAVRSPTTNPPTTTTHPTTTKARSTSTSRDGSTGHPTTQPPATMGDDPGTIAATGSLGQGDLHVATDVATPAGDAAHTDDPCSPMSHSTFLANHQSPQFQTRSASTIAINSQVTVEPTIAQADAVVARMSTDAWAQNCDKAHYDTDFNRLTSELNAKGCNAATSSSVVRIDTAKFGHAVVGWQFTSTTRCSDGTEFLRYADSLITSVGPVVVGLFTISNDNPPPDFVLGAIVPMVKRLHTVVHP